MAPEHSMKQPKEERRRRGLRGAGEVGKKEEKYLHTCITSLPRLRAMNGPQSQESMSPTVQDAFQPIGLSTTCTLAWGEWECEWHTSCMGNQMAGLKSLQLCCLAAYSSAHILQLRPHPSVWLFSTASMGTAHCSCVLTFRQGLEELEDNVFACNCHEVNTLIYNGGEYAVGQLDQYMYKYVLGTT